MTTPTTLVLAALMRLRRVGRKQALRLVPCELPEGTDVEGEVHHLAMRAGRAAEVVGVLSVAHEALASSRAAGIEILGFHDAGYPALLKDTPDPPAILYVKGSLSALKSSPSVAVVGTREPTEYGGKVARKLACRVAEAGYVVVSGLAHGCDTLGHEGCLDAGGVGVAVMAHGLDKVYPAANRGLAQRLIENGGCLVSEYPLGVTPMRNAFAERDRIQSGMSDAVLVIETDVKGGTMHTVRFAREQRRPLACIAHPPRWQGEEKTRGNRKMVEDKWATAIPDAEALMAFLAGLPRRTERSGETAAHPGGQHRLEL